MNLKDKKILVTGGQGFLGKHLVRKLTDSIVSIPESDLRVLENCRQAVSGQEIVIHLAANVGGIGLNKEKPGELFYDNAIMGIQLMEEARQARVKKFITIGTICAYPEITAVPFKEEDLWLGYPEKITAPYGLAKKMLLVQGQAYAKQYGFNAVFLMPTNLYGPEDNFNEDTSHVIPALIKKFTGKENVETWGTGEATREFLYVEDAVKGIILAVKNYDKPDPINLGTGVETKMKDLVKLIVRLTNFPGEIKWNPAKPDGQPRRNLDISRAKEFGFEAQTSLEEGLKKTIEWYQANKK